MKKALILGKSSLSECEDNNSYTEELKKTIVALYESGKKVEELVSEYDLEKKVNI